jgi:hypothetical protein
MKRQKNQDDLSGTEESRELIAYVSGATIHKKYSNTGVAFLFMSLDHEQD